jgi:hypothetical protein
MTAVGQIENKEKGQAFARPFTLSGGPCAIRTHDQQIKSLLLYRLS